MEINLVQEEKIQIDGIEMPVNKVVHATWIKEMDFQKTLIELVGGEIKGVEEGLKSGKYNFAKLQISHHTNDCGPTTLGTERSDVIGYALVDNTFVKSLNLGSKEVLSLASIDEFRGIIWHNIEQSKAYEMGLKDLVQRIIDYFSFDFAKVQRKLGPISKNFLEVESAQYEYITIIALRPNTTDHFNLNSGDWKQHMGLRYGRYQSFLTETFAICEEENIKVSNQNYEIIDVRELFNTDGSKKSDEVVLRYFGTSLKNVVPMLKRTILRRLERLKKQREAS